MANPQVAFCTYASDFCPVVTLAGEAHFVEDINLKKRVLDEHSMIKEIYHSPDNPVFKVFYIQVREIDTFSFSEGSKNIKL